ncbi:hypothetical protein D3C73_1245970 [compost metagenome]
MLVWKAMPSITPVMSPIRLDAPSMACMVSTTRCMAWLPSLAAPWVEAASSLACRACAAFWRTVAVSSSIEAAVSCRCAACRSLRSDSAPLPAAISLAAVLMVVAQCWMCPTIPANWLAVAFASRWIAANAP